jgi:hypothetical protein
MSKINYLKKFKLNNKYVDIMYPCRTNMLKRKGQRIRHLTTASVYLIKKGNGGGCALALLRIPCHNRMKGVKIQ